MDGHHKIVVEAPRSHFGFFWNLGYEAVGMMYSENGDEGSWLRKDVERTNRMTSDPAKR